MGARNSIDLERDPRAIIATRVLDAPRALVWTVWTDPKHLAQWWGPNGFSTTTSAFEFRAGGVWRFVMHGPDGRDYENRITFDEIVKPERIRYHHGGGDDVEPVQFRTTVTFEDLGEQDDQAHPARRLPVGRRARAGDQGLRRRQGRGADAVASRRLRGRACGLTIMQTVPNSTGARMPIAAKASCPACGSMPMPRPQRTTTSHLQEVQDRKNHPLRKRGPGDHGKAAGSVMTVEFEIDG